MAQANKIQTNFVFGENSPLVSQRIDIEVNRRSLAKCENFIPRLQGPFSYRPGTFYGDETIGRIEGKSTLIPFVFKDAQAYLLELTVEEDPGSSEYGYLKIKFWQGDEKIVGTSGTDGWLAADTTAWDSTAPTYKTANQSAGDDIVLNIEARSGSDTFEPEDLENIHYAQSGDVLLICKEGRYLIQIIRGSSGGSAWGANLAVTGDPADFHSFTFKLDAGFSSTGSSNFIALEEYPHGLCFYKGRLYLIYQDKLYGSNALNNSVDNYVKFTQSSPVVPDDAINFTVAVSTNRVNLMRWIRSNNNALYIGMEGLIAKATGETEGDAIAGDSFDINNAENSGVAEVLPIVDSKDIIYVANTNRKVSSFRYELSYDSEKSTDITVLANHFFSNDINRIEFQRGENEIVWVLRDNKLFGVVYDSYEKVHGWFQYTDGDDANIKDICVVPKDEGVDRLWLLTERKQGFEETFTIAEVDSLPLEKDLTAYYKDLDPEKMHAVIMDGDTVVQDLTYTPGTPSVNQFTVDTSVSPPSIKVGGSDTVGEIYDDENEHEIDTLYVFQKSYDSIEYLDEFPIFVRRMDFNTGAKNDDDRRFRNAIQEQQRLVAHLDSMGYYSAFDYTYDMGYELRLTESSGEIVSAEIYNSSGVKLTSGYGDSVGQLIVISSNRAGEKQGIFEITEYSSGTITLEQLKELSGYDIFYEETYYKIPAGSWCITFSSYMDTDGSEFGRFYRASGDTVDVVAEGNPAVPVEIEFDNTQGTYTLDFDLARITTFFYGFTFKGIAQTLDIDIGGVSGSAFTKLKNIIEVNVDILSTLGLSIGTELYDAAELEFGNEVDEEVYDRPPALVSGIKRVQPVIDNWGRSKSITIVKNDGLPGTIRAIDIFGDTADE